MLAKLPRFLAALAAPALFGTLAFAAAESKVIALPPYFVEETTQRLPWRYADVGEWEVLSSCPERLTRTLIANHHRLHALLDELVPPALQLSFSEKQKLLFVDAAQLPPTSEEVVAAMSLTTTEKDSLDDPAVPLDDGRLRRRPPPPRYTFVPNLWLWDRDGGALFAIVREREFDAARVALTPDYVAYVLRNRLPALPPWFVSGVLTLFARAKFSENALTLERLDWVSASGADALRGGAEANRPLLPMGEFFAGQLLASGAPQDDALMLWQAQAALFVRWGLSGRGAPRREALWKFVARAAVEPVTETLFQECFGVDFAAAQEQLTAFLPEAMREKLTLRPAQRPRPADYVLRPANDVEIARIKGDWERLEVSYVKTEFPGLVAKYTDQARHTLRRAYAGGSRDPRLLAELGLCEADAGNDAAARSFLEEAAAQTKAVRPRAWLELARLRFAALPGSDATAGAARRRSPEQIADVLAPLMAARGLQPPLAEVYDLLADAWAASAQAPTREQFAVLEEGVRLFPHRTELVYRVAELSLRDGFTDSARWLVNLGLTLAPEAATRARFEALQAKVNAGAKR